MPFIYSSTSRRKKTWSNPGCTGCSSTHCSSCVYVYTPHAEHSLTFLPKHILSISLKSLVYVGLRFFCIENCIWNTMKEREHGAALFVPASFSALLSTLVLRKLFTLTLKLLSRQVPKPRVLWKDTGQEAEGRGLQTTLQSGVVYYRTERVRREKHRELWAKQKAVGDAHWKWRELGFRTDWLWIPLATQSAKPF